MRHRARGRVWAEVLGIEPPEPDDDFFLLGGDSLSALAVVKRLVEWDGGEWPPDGVVHGPLAPQILCQHPTLASYSLHLNSSGAAEKWQVGLLRRTARAL